MNLSIQQEIHSFGEELQKYCTSSFLNELEKELGFVQRSRKFTGYDLTSIRIWISQLIASDSLVRICNPLHVTTETLISPEGLNKRFNSKAVSFFKQYLLNYYHGKPTRRRNNLLRIGSRLVNVSTHGYLILKMTDTFYKLIETFKILIIRAFLFIFRSCCSAYFLKLFSIAFHHYC